MEDDLPALLHRRRILHPSSPIPHLPSHRGEPELRLAIVRMLRADGIAVETSVQCAAGAADIVTARRDVIFEVKHRLSRTTIYQGLGQLLCYRSCINSQARAILIGYATSDTEALRPHVVALGVELVTWRDEMAGRAAALGAEIEAEAKEAALAPDTPTSNSLPQRSVLRWNVAQLARARGYPNVAQLARAMGVARQGLYALWQDQAIQVALSTLERLARALEAEIGDWFAWAPTGAEGQVLRAEGKDAALGTQNAALVWNVRSRMESLGRNPVDLAFEAQLYSGSAIPILDGVAQAVHVETLGKLAQALDTLEHPFRIGDLFTWERDTRMR